MSRTISQVKTVGDLKKILDKLDDNLEIEVSSDSYRLVNKAEIFVHHNCLQISIATSKENSGWISSMRFFHINPDYLT